MAAHLKQIVKCKHHEQAELCNTRAKYRQGRKLTAVKVYTINQESKYLLIQGVPAVGAKNELENMCSDFGVIEDINVLDDYPTAEFTEAYCIKYKNIQSARFAKKKLDDRSFFGGNLHICYAPEFETIADTREKLEERRRIITAKTKNSGPNTNREKWKRNLTGTGPSSTEPKSQPETKNDETISPPSQEPITYIWAGKTYTVDNTQPSSHLSDSNKTSESKTTTQTQGLFIPRQLKRPTLKPKISLENSSNAIRKKLKHVSEPTMLVNFKRRKNK